LPQLLKIGIRPFSRLDPSNQEILARGTGFVATSNAGLDGTIYNLRYGPPSKGIEFEKPDVKAIAAGYYSFREAGLL
jgi:hypothetical protein